MKLRDGAAVDFVCVDIAPPFASSSSLLPSMFYTTCDACAYCPRSESPGCYYVLPTAFCTPSSSDSELTSVVTPFALSSIGFDRQQKFELVQELS